MLYIAAYVVGSGSINDIDDFTPPDVEIDYHAYGVTLEFCDGEGTVTEESALKFGPTD